MATMKGLFICTFICLSLSPAAFAANFSNFYFLGDSLTDIGNNPGCDASIHGGSKQPDSKNWAQFFAEEYGYTVIKSDSGGNNFAYGGAESGYESRVTGADKDHNRGARTQVDQLISREAILDSRALYSMYIGANDIIGYFAGQTGKTQAQVTTECGPNIAASLNKLHDAGARIIVLGNLPDLSNIPIFYETEDAAAARRMSQEINEAIRNEVNNIGYDVIQIDLYGFFVDAIANKERYGFLHGPEDCASLHPSDNYDYYIYWDIAHPTQAVYRIMADYYYSVLSAPYYFASLTDTPYKVLTARNDIIRQRLAQQPAAGTKLHIFADVEPVTVSESAPDNSTRGGSVGFIYQVSLPLSVGASFAYSPNRGAIDGGTFTYDLNDTTVSLFADCRRDSYFLNAIAGWSSLQYQNIARQIALGPVTEGVSALTNGYQYAVGVSGGCWLPTGVAGVETGLTINSTYQYTGVDGYTEDGQKDYLQIVYDNQHVETLDAGVGWGFNLKKPVAEKNTFIASANLRINKQFLNNEREIAYHIQSIAGSHGAVPVSIAADCYTSAGISAAYVFSDSASVSLGYNGYFGNDIYNNNVINLEVGMFLL
jgi:outer membrane lipase/esterase